jgi:D-alanine-D-alanine ligase
MAMKVGITYDLREEYLALGYGEEETAEFDRCDTIDAIEQALQNLGYETDRIGSAMNLAGRLLGGDRWDMVFNIAEGLNGLGRESLVPALLDAYALPYTFSDPLVLSLTLHKAMAKRVLIGLGIPTPDFFVVERQSDADRSDISFPLFVKPLAEGTGKGITASSKVLNRRHLLTMCRKLLADYRQPVLVERFLPGREFTVGMLGSGADAFVLGVMEVILKENAEQNGYSYLNKEQSEELVEYRLVDDAVAQKAGELALLAFLGLGCRDAGRADLRVDESGVPNFIEINPLAGLHPEHSDLCIIAAKAGMPYRNLIGAIMSSATSRYKLEKRDHAKNENRHHLQRAAAARRNALGILGRHSYASRCH